MTATASPITPRADRPVVPAEYGVPAHADGLRSWADIERRLTESKVYWLATAGADGQPHGRPVDGLWLDGVLYVGGSPATRWMRDLAENPRVSVHLEDGFDVVILDGDAEMSTGLPREVAERLAAASNEKYPQYGTTVDDYLGPGPVLIRPRRGYAWSSFPSDVTRFTFG